MKTSTITLVFAVLVLSSCGILPIKDDRCLDNEIYTKDRGCIKSCKSPEFKNCGDVFITLWDPKFCAYFKDGSWKSYTFDCQACKNAEVLGVGKGNCEETAVVPDTPVVIVDPKPTTSKCPENEVFSPRGCIQSCAHPDFKTCKDRVFPAIYDPSLCAFKKDGSSQSFTYACEACGTYPDTEWIGVSAGVCD